MRVAIVVPYASFVEANMCEALGKSGIEAWIIKADRERLEYRKAGIDFETHVKTIRLPCMLDNSFFTTYPPFPIMPELFDTIDRLKPDIVNVSEHIESTTWLLSLNKNGWKTVLTEHGYKWSGIKGRIYTPLAKKLIVPHIDGFVGIGVKAKNFLDDLGARNVHVIPNPINCHLFKKTLPYEKRKNIVMYSGQIDTWRGLHILLAAMRLVRERIQGARLQIMGPPGNLSDFIQQKGRQYGVDYLGVIPHKEAVKYYNEARVYVSPFSSIDLAGCGCALEEALACGTPIVGTTPLDFPFDWIKNKIGYLVEPNSLNLAKAIIEILLNGDGMSESSRLLAQTEFSQESVGKKYLHVFNEVLQEK